MRGHDAHNVGRVGTEKIMTVTCGEKTVSRKIKIHSEAAYFIAIFMLSFSVAMIAATDFGVSMIVGSAYILSQKFDVLTFGQWEYVVQGTLFIVFCILMKKVKLTYFSAFLTGVIYGAVLDLWRILIPHFNPAVTVPGELPMAVRIIYFIIGIILTGCAVAIFFKVYIYPQVYDFFVKGISNRFNKDRIKFKRVFDACGLALSCILTLTLFHRFVGIGVGTLIMTFANSFIIGFFSKILDKYFEFEPLFKNFAKKFDIE